MNLDNLSMDIEERILLENEARDCDFERGRDTTGHVNEINGPANNLGSFRHEAIRMYADQIRELNLEEPVRGMPRI